MSYPKVLDSPADYEKIGVKPGVVQQWEDGRRSAPDQPIMENWYFDATMDDGTKLVISFRPNSPAGINPGAGGIEGGLNKPNINIHVTSPDGQTYTDFIFTDPQQSTTAADRCDLEYGPHYFRGDLTDYDIHVEPVNGVGADVHFHALVEPFRPGTGYVAFNEDNSLNYTWTTIPRGEVTGTVTADGETRQVHGNGYHDHQWHTINPIQGWHHWLWGRQTSGDLTVAIFDLVANEKFDFKRVPIIAVMDKSGQIIFSNIDEANSTVEVQERYFEPETKKEYPHKTRYTYENNGTRVVYTLEVTQQIEVRSAQTLMINADPAMKAKFDALGINPSYLRYAATGDITVTDLASGDEQHSVGDVIYEFPYFGNPDPRAHL